MEETIAKLEATKTELIMHGWKSLGLGYGDGPKCLLGAAAVAEGVDFDEVYTTDTPMLQALREQAYATEWYQTEWGHTIGAGAYLNASVYRVNDSLFAGLGDAIAFIDDTIISVKEKA